eukprot:TRINITY_DN1045_c0_g1_i1.p1 TRINITY_DN1045_c0_g1~~TRINITY_DN1045_c0_g1_i1.p1  ORF type:complete len:854 (+),score=236.40 TRINITY_DN1045_c0_g1_i1:72-2633(+)
MDGEMESPLVSGVYDAERDEAPVKNVMRALIGRAPTAVPGTVRAALKTGYDRFSVVRVLQYIHSGVATVEEDSTFSLWDQGRATCLVRTKLPYTHADGADLVVGGGVIDGHVVVCRGRTLDAYDLDPLRKASSEEGFAAFHPDFTHTFSRPCVSFAFAEPYFPARHVFVGLEGGGVAIGKVVPSTSRNIRFEFVEIAGDATNLMNVTCCRAEAGVLYAAGDVVGSMAADPATQEAKYGVVVPMFVEGGDLLHPDGGMGRGTNEIVGSVRGLAVYEGHSLIVAAKNLTVWSVSDDGPFMKKRFMKLWGTADPHQGASCTGLLLHPNGVGVTAGTDGSIKIWNFGKSSCAMPFVMRVLPPFESDAPPGPMLKFWQWLGAKVQAEPHCLSAGWVDGTAGADCWQCFAVGGTAAAVEEWECEAAFHGKDEPGLKAPDGCLVPIAHHIPPTKVYCRAPKGGLILAAVAMGVTVLQLLSLPFSEPENLEMWSSAAEPVTHTLPLLNLKASLPRAVYETVFWVTCFVSAVFSFMFVYGTLDRLRIRSARVKGMANGNWPALKSHDAAERRGAEQQIGALNKQHSNLEKRVTAAWRFMWAVSGVFLMPMVCKLSEVYACMDVEVNATVADGDDFAVRTVTVWTAVLESEVIECYSAYHWWKMIVGGVCLLCLCVISLRLALVKGDARLLCRYVVSEATGEPRPSLANRLWKGPFVVRAASTLPPSFRPSAYGSSIMFVEACVKVGLGMFTSVTINQGYTPARTEAIAMIAAFGAIVLFRIPRHALLEVPLEKVMWSVAVVTLYCAICRFCTVQYYISYNEAANWPIMAVYLGFFPCFAVAHLVHGWLSKGPRRASFAEELE